MLTTIFILLILGGLGFPMPEEIPLFLGGILATKEPDQLQLIFFVCYAGVLIGDQTMYVFGYFFGNKLLDAGTKSPFFPSITEARVNDIRDGLRKRRLVYIFFGRHLFLLRSVTFVAAGALRIPYREFFFADALAALVSVSIFMTFGYLLGHQIEPELFAKYSHEVNTAIVGIAALCGLGFLAFRKFSKKGTASEDPSSIDETGQKLTGTH